MSALLGLRSPLDTARAGELDSRRMSLRHLLRPKGAVLGALALSGALLGACAASERARPDAVEAGQAAEAQQAFAAVARVLRHPRCLNCHPSGDFPRVGGDRRPHPQNVQRGPDDRGMPGMGCAACHQAVNQDLAGVPGAPAWHLAPRSMGWEGLDDHALAEALKDPVKNGRRSLADLLHHMAEDPLVGWAWDPGRGRAAPPVAREAFVRSFRAWIEGGAPSPPPGITSTF